jgi:hypothetical protein
MIQGDTKREKPHVPSWQIAKRRLCNWAKTMFRLANGYPNYSRPHTSVQYSRVCLVDARANLPP